MEEKIPVILLGLDEDTLDKVTALLRKAKKPAFCKKLNLFAINILDIDNLRIGEGKDVLREFFEDPHTPSQAHVLIVAGGDHFTVNAILDLKDAFPCGSVIGLGHVDDTETINSLIYRHVPFAPMNNQGIHEKIFFDFLNNEASRLQFRRAGRVASNLIKSLEREAPVRAGMPSTIVQAEGTEP